MVAPAIPAVLTETVLTNGQAAKLLKVDPVTVRRWITIGLNTGKRTVRLEGARIGTRFRTSREAIARFLEVTQDLPPPVPIETASELQKRHARAMERIRKRRAKRAKR